MPTTNKLQVVYKDTDELIPYARNPKKHSAENISQIAGSIKSFGFNAPVLIDSANGIIAGHGRVLAAKKLGIKQVPCVELDGMLTPAACHPHGVHFLPEGERRPPSPGAGIRPDALPSLSPSDALSRKRPLCPQIFTYSGFPVSV